MTEEWLLILRIKNSFSLGKKTLTQETNQLILDSKKAWMTKEWKAEEDYGE